MSQRNVPHHVLMIGALLAVATTGGCKEDEGPGKLFEEDGTWELVQYDIGDGLAAVDAQNREEAFMLKFDAGQQVVQTAMCAENETQTPTTSLCRLLENETQWFCRCFAYAYEGDRMLWQEFQPGETPPMVTFTDDGMSSTPPATSGGGGDTDTDGGGGGETGAAPSGGGTEITVAPFGMISSTYGFRPLPTGVFGSQGASSNFIFSQKARSKFDQVFEDPDGRPSCTPCIPELAE